jgi:hypothetical protein
MIKIEIKIKILGSYGEKFRLWGKNQVETWRVTLVYRVSIKAKVNLSLKIMPWICKGGVEVDTRPDRFYYTWERSRGSF